MTNEPAATSQTPANSRWNLDLPISKIFAWNLENFLVLIVLFLAIVTRLYGLGDRAFSHDEVNAISASYSLATTGNLSWLPMEHGPLQMHLIALSFIVFGDNDFTARLPAALFSVATVGIALLLFRRYLGRKGALVAGLLFLISPYMLYYGRYQRNEAFIIVWSLLTMYAVLRYLERGEAGILVLFTAVNALHFTDKATGYIYAGGTMIFLTGYFISRLIPRMHVSRQTWLRFLISLAVAAVFLIASAIMLQHADFLTMIPGVLVGAVGLAAAGYGFFLLVPSLRAINFREDRSFDLMVLLGTLVLPFTAAVFMGPLGKVFGTKAPQDMLFSSLRSIPDLLKSYDFYTSMAYIIPLVVISVLIGILWKRRLWPILALIFLGIFAVFFTTVFTNAGGLFDGMVSFLGYWIQQHAEQRGGQPWFYYVFLQIPIYEYLPAIGTVIASAIAIRRKLWISVSEQPFQPPSAADDTQTPLPTISLFLFWTLFSLGIFSWAGEKMPQETMLISAPMILAAAWAAGYLLETKSAGISQKFFRWTLDIPAHTTQLVRWATLVVLAVLALLTARTAYFATYVNYDYPDEYMAYAHGGTGPKIVLKEIERLSNLTTGGPYMVVAYDYWMGYPYWWSLRHYPNQIDFVDNPTADIRRAAVVVVSDQNNDKVVPILGQDYVSFRLTRMWWHNEDYFNLKWDYINTEYLGNERAKNISSPPRMSIGEYLKLAWGHIAPFFTNPKVREAVLQIWLNRDFTQWGELKGHGGYTLDDWSLHEGMTVYFRKDILDYLGGSTQGIAVPTTGYDPYELSRIDLVPDLFFGQTGNQPGQFSAPRAVAVAPDASLYVADSLNHRIEHFDAKGNLLKAWGSFADVQQGNAPGGTFNEPWGIAVGPDGSVYVADTWNHRIQKFSADGAFLAMWGAKPGTATADEVRFYGPRAIAVDAQGRVFVSDTGNKRIVIFSSDGQLLGQFGTPGAGDGQLDEPVGLAMDEQGKVYVADTWNHRVQIFAPGADGVYAPVEVFDVNGWFGTSPDTKPYLTVDSVHHIYITDPGTCRIIEFNERGVVLSVWGACGDDPNSLNTPTGLAVDPQGGLWVTDTRHDRLVHYTQPNRVGDILQSP
jgi:predicted membrane-bound mannosyltransferase/DNA-binding beta-propeller fold protein YncE